MINKTLFHYYIDYLRLYNIIKVNHCLAFAKV